MKKISDKIEGFTNEISDAENKMRELKEKREGLEEHGREVIDSWVGIKAHNIKTWSFSFLYGSFIFYK